MREKMKKRKVKKLVQRFAGFLLSATMLISYFAELFGGFDVGIFAYAESADNTATPIVSEETFYTLPQSMHSVEITIGYDFFTDSTQSAEETRSEIDELFENLTLWEMNTIIIDTDYNGVGYFDLDSVEFKNGSPLAMLIEDAREKGFYVFVNYDLGFALTRLENADLEERINYLAYTAHKITSKYRIDGIIIDGYYNSKTPDSYYSFTSYGGGESFEEWLLNNGAYVFGLVSRAIRKTSNTVAVGISISNAWANAESVDGGSETSDSFQALTDGFADTASYITGGYADFVLLKASGSLTDSSVPLEAMTAWWNGLADSAGVPLYVQHSNDKLGTDARGWSMYDQIIKQLDAIKGYSAYKGSSFASYSALDKNIGTSTDLLVKFYHDNVDMDSLNTELTMVSPTQYQYTTYDPTVKFQGAFDENFDVTFNGTPITLNEAGNFYFEEDLKVGVNTFVISNKGKSAYYSITRKVKVLNGVTPSAGNDMYVEEKSKINVVVEAYKGSSVSATLNGKTIYLTEQTSASDGLDENSAYANFTGFFTAPEGIILEEQDLGTIVINGAYENCYESIYGSRIIVNALPEPAPLPEGVTEGTIVEITTDNALTYNYYTTDNIADPESPRLPKGTRDYYVKTVTYNLSDQGTTKSLDFYLTASGKRIRATEAILIDDYTFGATDASVTDSYVSNGDTIIKLKIGGQVPFTVSYSPCDYYAGDTGGYFVKSFSATKVYITFDYVTSTGALPTFGSDALFSSASWSTTSVDGVAKYRLELNLRQAGIFAGVTSSYDGSGNLTLRFNGYPSSLSEAVIVIDPGHGYSRSATTFDPGSVGHVTEQVVNLAMAKTLAEKLRNQGATVYVLPTDTTYINVYQRADYVRTNYMPDLFLSIHCNGISRGEGVRGVETHYFTPFSREIAGLIAQNMASYYQNSVYMDGKNRLRGAYWNYFAVTLMQDFPSLLIECGFVTDSVEAMVLANPTHQAGLCDAIVSACKTYFAQNTTT